MNWVFAMRISARYVHVIIENADFFDDRSLFFVLRRLLSTSPHSTAQDQCLYSSILARQPPDLALALANS